MSQLPKTIPCARPIIAAFALCLALTGAARAHPHVFVDGGVDFVFRDGTVLEEVRVTWRYDEFETLYILSSYDMALNADGTLDESDRRDLVRLRSEWPSDFDGSAHLSHNGALVGLAWPENLDAELIDGRLELTFSRRLTNPIILRDSPVETGFYESTYFFAFSVTQAPRLLGDIGSCSADVIPFVANAADTKLQLMLAKLGREDTPAVERVGAYFADRIVLKCV